MKAKLFIFASACLALTACENHDRKEKQTVIHEKNTETYRDADANDRGVRSRTETEVRNSRDRSDY